MAAEVAFDIEQEQLRFAEFRAADLTEGQFDDIQDLRHQHYTRELRRDPLSN